MFELKIIETPPTLNRNTFKYALTVISMCVIPGFNPLAVPMPYIISGAVSTIATILLAVILHIKKLDQKYLKILLIALIIASVSLFVLAYFKYVTQPELYVKCAGI